MANTENIPDHLHRSRPCPFAEPQNGNLHELQLVGDFQLDTVQVVCACGAKGPTGNRPSEAVDRWNIRYADIQIASIQQAAGVSVIAAQMSADEHRRNLHAMQVENNKYLERARTAEATLELTTKLAEKAATDHG